MHSFSILIEKYPREYGLHVERGVIHLIEGQTAFAPDDGWSIAGADYQVFTGFIRSFQAEVEGSTSDPLGLLKSTVWSASLTSV